MNKILSWRSYH